MLHRVRIIFSETELFSRVSISFSGHNSFNANKKKNHFKFENETLENRFKHFRFRIFWAPSFYSCFKLQFWIYNIGHDATELCNPSPCGLNSQCRIVNGHAVCSCLPDYIGSPPDCRPECVISSECALNKACINRKCVDPCTNACGQNARCHVVNHKAVCSCSVGYTGDPFLRCVVQRKCLALLFQLANIVWPLKLSFLHVIL